MASRNVIEKEMLSVLLLKETDTNRASFLLVLTPAIRLTHTQTHTHSQRHISTARKRKCVATLSPDAVCLHLSSTMLLKQPTLQFKKYFLHPSKQLNSGVPITLMATGVEKPACRRADCFYKHVWGRGRQLSQPLQTSKLHN